MPSKGPEPLGDFLSREEDGIVALPALQGVDQLGRGAGIGGREHDDASHWVAGPLICRSTASKGSLRRAAARTGEISSSPMARQTSRLNR